ncbi:RHS repeat-associated core domain-containing protein [Methylomonas sp. HW2-6]|uniref:RHS repeat-associated core domain-containing protein n=1 Tax=Methylomonas sp. HW2-6 TaxID=3376687 RepID=UPI0040436129
MVRRRGHHQQNLAIQRPPGQHRRHRQQRRHQSATLSYGPYGEPNATIGVRFRYTGQQLLGPLNLYYYKARMYSPAIGRFLQTDPIGYSADMNLYAYFTNNPINLTDSSGNCPSCFGAVSSVVMGGVIRGLTGW